MLTFRKINNLPNLVDEFFNHELPNSWNRQWTNVSVPAVNIVEKNDAFKIEVAVPGLKKDDFKINIENDSLTISASVENKTEESNETFTRREFNYSSFCRRFTLPETVDGESIRAEHKDGIVNIYIPKKEEAKPKPAREIAIA